MTDFGPEAHVPPSIEVEATALGDDIRREAEQMIQDPHHVADVMRSMAKTFPNDSWAQHLAAKYDVLANDPDAFAKEQQRLKTFDDPPTTAYDAAAELGLEVEDYLEG